MQSTACLVLAAQRLIDFPLFIFANTGDDSENPVTLSYLRNVAMPYAYSHGIDLVEVVKTKRTGVVETLYQNCVGANSTIAIPVRMSNGAPGNRKCTVDWKIKVVAKETKRRGASRKKTGVVGIGISVDELHRAKDSRILHQTHEFPLLDLRLTRADCWEVIKKAGLPVPPKSSCWFCPYKKKSEWQEMATHEPEMFARACELEVKLQAKRVVLGKDRIYLTDALKPLAEAVLPNNQLKLFEVDECGGYCMT